MTMGWLVQFQAKLEWLQLGVAKLQERVDRINGLEETIEDLEDEELQAKTESIRQRLQNGEDINGSLLEEAFVVVCEAAW